MRTVLAIVNFPSLSLGDYTIIINRTLYSTAPDPPTDLKVTQASASSIAVSWTPPPNPTGVTGYSICYTKNGGKTRLKEVKSASTDTYKIGDLTPGSIYTIRIRAISDASLPSGEVGPEEITLGMRN